MHVPVESRALRQLGVCAGEELVRDPGREIRLNELVADRASEDFVYVQRETGQAGVGGERLDEVCERRGAADGEGVEHFLKG